MFKVDKSTKVNFFFLNCHIATQINKIFIIKFEMSKKLLDEKKGRTED
jgi:hypothetical protein